MKQKSTWGILIVLALLAALVYKHKTCPDCQRKWNAWLMHCRNWFANRVAQKEVPVDGSDAY